MKDKIHRSTQFVKRHRFELGAVLGLAAGSYITYTILDSQDVIVMIHETTENVKDRLTEQNAVAIFDAAKNKNITILTQDFAHKA